MYQIPKNVSSVLDTLLNAEFEAFLVGGCVRDLILEREPKDWDVTTNATPEEIQGLFKKTVYENTFGTVAIVFEDETNEKFKIIEVTPYRIESEYSDKRHPDEVRFTRNIEEDLKRRDFTVNALAMDHKGHIIDLYKGQQDLKDKILKTVGNPNDRFQEDALRMMRAIRFSVELGFVIDYETMSAVSKNKDLLKNVSWERVRDEFSKIIVSREPMRGIALLEQLGLLEYIVPELREGIGCEQKGAHIYDVFEHMLHALEHAKEKDQPLEIRLSALFHDIGKPKTRRYDRTKDKYTFFGHEVVGARMTQKILEKMRYPKHTVELVVKLVRYHMFFSDTETITLSAVRRTITNVGKENIWKLMDVRECDRVGMKKKEAPYRLRKYHAMIEEALRDPISVSQLVLDGNYLMRELQVKPGPRMGWILHALLEEVLEDPKLNTIEKLTERVKELDTLNDKELKILGIEGKEKKEEWNDEEVSELRKKHGVK